MITKHKIEGKLETVAEEVPGQGASLDTHAVWCVLGKVPFGQDQQSTAPYVPETVPFLHAVQTGWGPSGPMGPTPNVPGGHMAFQLVEDVCVDDIVDCSFGCVIDRVWVPVASPLERVVVSAAIKKRQRANDIVNWCAQQKFPRRNCFKQLQGRIAWLE
jgi:hypothetical protein